MPHCANKLFNIVLSIFRMILTILHQCDVATFLGYEMHIFVPKVEEGWPTFYKIQQNTAL